MKNKIIIISLMLLTMVLPSMVSASSIGEFKENINISLNIDSCEPDYTPEVKFQLYADNEAVEGKEIVLDKKNEYKGVFEDLPVFKEGTYEEIKYEVKFYENGEYKSISPEEITYKKSKISKWAQVLPEDIKPGHQYALFTYNWNHEENGLGRLALVNGDMALEETNAEADYKLIDGKKSYFSLTQDPSENSLWTITSVPSSDTLYEGFENYWVFTNYQSKRLSLSGFDKGDWIDYVFRQTSKPDGFASSDYSWNTTKVELIPIENEAGHFMITSHNVINEQIRGTKYMGVDHFYMIKAQAEEEYAGHFLLFEYLDDVEVEEAYNVMVDKVLCKKEVNPETSNKIFIIIIPILTMLIALGVSKIKNKKLA